MQILQWLFKVAHEPPRETSTPSSPTIKKESDSDQKAKSKVKVVNRQLQRIEESQLGWKNLNPFTILHRSKGLAKTCFYTRLNLKRLGSFHRRQRCNIYSMKLKKEDIARGLGIGHHRADSAGHVGNKVQPISDVALSYSGNVNEQCGMVEKKDKVKGDKTKTISKMKELWRWAAAAKTEKGGKYISRKVFHFRNRSILKAVPDDDQMSNDSPKISFRWDMESCSTSSSVYSAMTMASSTKIDQTMSMPSFNSTPIHDRDHSCTGRTGNWITTDTEFVVLEL